VSIEHAPERGRVAVLWFNDYAGMTIRTPERTLVVDPADVDPNAFTSVDAVLITHEHYDHLDTSIVQAIQRRTGCLVVADPTSFRALGGVVPKDKLIMVRPGSELNVGNVKVRVEGCNHPPASTPVTYLITSEDGVCIYHTADSLPFPDMRRIGQDYKPHVVFCTVGIAPGASPEAGVEIAKLIQPQIAVPYHTRGTSNLQTFASILSREAPNIRCLVMERGKAYTVP